MTSTITTKVGSAKTRAAATITPAMFVLNYLIQFKEE